MNLKELREAIRINIDDMHGDMLDDNKLNSIIYRAYLHLYRKIIDANVSPNVTSISLTFSADNREVIVGPTNASVAPDSNLQRAIRCEDSDGFEIPIMDMEACLKNKSRSVYIRRQIGTLSPTEKHYLGYFETPSSSFTVTLYYIPKISYSFSTMEDSEEFQFVPTEHHDVLINFATVLALGKDEINAKFWYNIYNESFRDMLATIGNETKKYGGVVDVTEDAEWM